MEAELEARRERGRRILQEVVGDAVFERREKALTPFNADLRALSEEYCFGTIWDRPGLPRQTRSLLCLAMLTALNRSSELKLHIGGALNNGCTVEQIKEALLQSVIYCGLPAGVEAFRVAEEVLRERGLVQ